MARRRRKEDKPVGLSPDEKKIKEFLLTNVVPLVSESDRFAIGELARGFKHIKEDDYFYVGKLLYAMYLREDLRRFVWEYASEILESVEIAEEPKELIREIAKQHGISYKEAYRLWMEAHKEMGGGSAFVSSRKLSSRKLGQILKRIERVLYELGFHDSTINRILILLTEAKDVVDLAEFYFALTEVAKVLSDVNKSLKGAKAQGEFTFVVTMLTTRPDSFVRALKVAVEEFLEMQPEKKEAETLESAAPMSLSKPSLEAPQEAEKKKTEETKEKPSEETEEINKDLASIIIGALSRIPPQAVDIIADGVKRHNKEVADIIFVLRDYRNVQELSRILGMIGGREELKGTSPEARKLYHYEEAEEEAFAYLSSMFYEINPRLPDFIIENVENVELARACMLFANEIHKIAREAKKDARKIIESVADVIRNKPNAFINLISALKGVPAEKVAKREAVEVVEARVPEVVLVGEKKVEYPRMLYAILIKLPIDLLVNLRNLSDEEKVKIFENLNILIRTYTYEIVGRLVREIFPKIARGEALTPEEEKIFEEYVLKKRAKKKKEGKEVPEYILTYDEAVKKIKEIPLWMWDVLRIIGAPSHILYFIRVCGKSPHLLSPEYLDEIIKVKKSAVVKEELEKPPVEEFGKKVKWRTYIPFRTTTFIREILIARGDRGAYPYEVYRAFKYVLWKAFPAERYYEFRREVAESTHRLKLRESGEHEAEVGGIDLDETLEGGPRVVDGALVSEVTSTPPLSKKAESKMKHPIFHVPQFSSFWKYFKVLEEAGLIKKKTEKVGEIPLTRNLDELTNVLEKGLGIVPKKIHDCVTEIYVEDRKSGNHYLLIPKENYYEVHLARIASEEGHFGKPPFARQYYVIVPERVDSPVWSAPQKFVYPMAVFGKKRYSEILRKARELGLTPYEYLAREIDTRLGELIRVEAGGSLLWGNIEWFFESLRTFKVEWHELVEEGGTTVTETVKERRKEFLSKYSEILPILEIFIMTAEDMIYEIAEELIKRQVMFGSPEEVAQKMLEGGPERLALYTAATFVLLEPFRKGKYKEVWLKRKEYVKKISQVFAKIWKTVQKHVPT